MLKRQSDEKIMAVRSLRCLMEKVERGPVGNEQAVMLTELIGYLCRNDMGAKSELSEQRLRYLVNAKRKSEGRQPLAASASFIAADASPAADTPRGDSVQHGEQSVSGESAPQEQPAEILEEPDSEQGSGLLDRLFSRFDKRAGAPDTEGVMAEPEPRTDEASVPAAPPDPREERRRELREKIAPRSNLLEETLRTLLPGAAPDDAAGVLEHWSITLDAGECRALTKSFESLAGDGTARLRAWLELLRGHGLEPVDADQSRLVVTTENRGRYANGVAVPDGAEAAIVCHPWTFDGSVCCTGFLELPPESAT